MGVSMKATLKKDITQGQLLAIRQQTGLRLHVPATSGNASRIASTVVNGHFQDLSAERFLRAYRVATSTCTS